MDGETKRLLQIIATNIRRRRKDQMLSQETLAEVSGLHRTYVGAVERAERNITISTLNSFAKALKTSVPCLLKEKETI